ncbi:MAG: Gfo/Idh/MocA family oxidoreductase [Candidatus Solibacter usitatus]|nr:Gfo/Idh/MocA family oxidoreductase [Candidatus Solibacter usitatus]
MNQNDRRDFLKAGAAAFTTQIFTGNLKGANDKYNAAFIGMGRMGRSNLGFAMKQDSVAVTHVCDVYQPNLELAHQTTKRQAKAVRDFREILADKSVDVVCIATPDHWHPYMMVEACKAGKDVYVEKPICVYIDEGKKMVEAARKYNRVVQAGTMQRSGTHFQKATEMVSSGKLGQVTAVHTWNYGLSEAAGIGNPPDEAPPSNLDWDMWLGPAQKREYNKNRFGVDPKAFSHFRWFWDYAGGMMTDWGVHWLDIVQMAFNEAMPSGIACVGGKYRLKDNRETPDTIHASYEYPGFICTYENRYGNAQSMFGKGGGILFHGDQGTLYVDRSLYKVVPERGSDLVEVEVKSSNQMNDAHWKNFLECVRTRQRPISDIEKCYRSTATCLLANIALRTRMRLDWDGETIKQPEGRKMMEYNYRSPWKLTV